ncbi:pyrroloquinoline quinone biosynthesis protein PqqE [Cohnella thailandensis]|uniref:PqqA peptide cyclase n=1 Tax=Cohnella thailandensis TaxID=557557 RepID=A0A841T619_9BACL|nr:pyrroloquinoline quinone biosynthesis protein PqqE [Cohnella thailandensis]MBB6638306.1 pyrroloquinoline quinone biosynthesis protein PqqE [Cohnella thailandensis]MBP1977216.1 pyrroloquinoline quinone biosynthesis protein E [Cohnella thailandensis]
MTASLPYALTAELTHRCPLHCPYCSNPIELQKRESELSTGEWLSVLEQANDLGVAQVHFTGGEPLLRPDLERLVRRARELGLYVNLITSGVGLTDERINRLVEAGIDSIQLSVQAASAELADSIAGFRAYELKRQAAQRIRERGLPLHMNVVLHRANLHQIEEIIELCADWGAERLELANAQYYGWALRNVNELLPRREQLQAAEAAYKRALERFGRRIELIWILPDYYEDFPKPCMGGWGRLSLTIAPDGRVLPCTASSDIRSLTFENVKERELAWIWHDSPSFNAYRGYDWMPEPCRSCERRELDYGGCRCQAFQLTGDARATDPVCVRSPHRGIVADRVGSVEQGKAGTPDYAYRGR